MLKTWLIFGAVCSLTSCAGFPKVTTCVSDPESGGMQCSLNGGEAEFKPYGDTGNYVCRSADDEQKIIEWAKRQCSKSTMNDIDSIIQTNRYPVPR